MQPTAAAALARASPAAHKCRAYSFGAGLIAAPTADGVDGCSEGVELSSHDDIHGARRACGIMCDTSKGYAPQEAIVKCPLDAEPGEAPYGAPTCSGAFGPSLTPPFLCMERGLLPQPSESTTRPP